MYLWVFQDIVWFVKLCSGSEIFYDYNPLKISRRFLDSGFLGNYEASYNFEKLAILFILLSLNNLIGWFCAEI